METETDVQSLNSLGKTGKDLSTGDSTRIPVDPRVTFQKNPRATFSWSFLKTPSPDIANGGGMGTETKVQSLNPLRARRPFRFFELPT